MKIASTTAVSPALDYNHNQLLAALSKETRERLAENLKPVSLPLSEVICESGGAERYVYFPTDSILSMLCVLKGGECAETSIIGNDGIVGVASFLGGENICSHAVVQKAGAAYRLPSQYLKDEFKRCGDLHWLFLRYTQSLMTQMSQNCGLQPPSHDQAATLSLAVVDARPHRWP